ncbi:transcription activator of gluconeogenesis ERT1 [Acrasis kona]|uniref:Transcription activator of gluconeogenesis ERT1 n=1 Tax=Acrasis kona TaxID=1008807 RepID=A0AAW2ZC65_9EUKA
MSMSNLLKETYMYSTSNLQYEERPFKRSRSIESELYEHLNAISEQSNNNSQSNTSPRKRKLSDDIFTIFENEVNHDTNFLHTNISSANVSLDVRRRKPRLSRACAGCNRSHAACEEARPCARCTRLGIECEEQPQRSQRAMRAAHKSLPGPIKPETIFQNYVDVSTKNSVCSSASNRSSCSLTSDVFESMQNSQTFDVESPGSITTLQANHRPLRVIVTAIYESGEQRSVSVTTPTDCSQLHTFQVGVDRNNVVVNQLQQDCFKSNITTNT